jgi:hypothetical protein
MRVLRRRAVHSSYGSLHCEQTDDTRRHMAEECAVYSAPQRHGCCRALTHCRFDRDVQTGKVRLRGPCRVCLCRVVPAKIMAASASDLLRVRAKVSTIQRTTAIRLLGSCIPNAVLARMIHTCCHLTPTRSQRSSSIVRTRRSLGKGDARVSTICDSHLLVQCAKWHQHFMARQSGHPVQEELGSATSVLCLESPARPRPGQPTRLALRGPRSA